MKFVLLSLGLLILQGAHGFGNNFMPLLFGGVIPQQFSVCQVPRLKHSRHSHKLVTMATSEENQQSTIPERSVYLQSSRRAALIYALTAIVSHPSAWSEGDTKLYKGPSAYGFEFRYPTGWKPNKKIGNRHLYDLEVRSDDGTSLISVTIDQITSNSTEQWASLEDAAERLRSQYEKQGGQKATIKSKASERDASGLTYYAFDIELEDGARFQTRLTTTAQVHSPLKDYQPPDFSAGSIRLRPNSAAAGRTHTVVGNQESTGLGSGEEVPSSKGKVTAPAAAALRSLPLDPTAGAGCRGGCTCIRRG
jgi:hypothetical protein